MIREEPGADLAEPLSWTLTMVDREARSELATCLERLVSGEMTNDEFDVCHDEWIKHTSDGAIPEIATFGWGLYSSGLPLPYRLEGRHAPADEIREKARRASVFLRTELEYEWPRDFQGIVPFWCVFGPGFYLVIALVVLFFARVEGGSRGFMMSVGGFLALLPAIYWLITYRGRVVARNRFQQSGDPEVWPFLRRADLEDATRALGLETGLP
jgi:hypothetical protein